VSTSLHVSEICELTLETSDIEAMLAFYELIGLERLTRGDGDRLWLSAGDRCRLGLWAPGEKEHGDRGGRHVHFALSVSTGALERIGDELSRQGHAVEGPVQHEGGDRSIYCHDPEGNRVELWDFFEREGGRQRGIEALADR
jgi:catechol-2,3-dioxygenase